MNSLEKNPVFINMSPEKQKFILEFQKKEKPSNPKEALPFILKHISLAQKQNISFSKEEIMLLYASFESQMTPSQKNKLSVLLNMIK